MCLSSGRQRRVIHLFALPSLPFCFRTHCLSSEVVRAADTYQQEVDTLNLTPQLLTPFKYGLADALFTFRLQLACQAALGLMINCSLQNYLRWQQCSRRHIHHENAEIPTLHAG